MTIASLMQQNYSQRDIAELLGCSASTISRELVRNAYQMQYAMNAINTDLALLRTAIRGR